MSYGNAGLTAPGAAPSRPIGEASALARTNLARIDNAHVRLQDILDRLHGPEPRAVAETATRASDVPLLGTLQRTDGALSALFELIERIDAAI
jgi:hypothetical protein